MKKLFITVMFLGSIPSLGWADVYECTEKSGRVYRTYGHKDSGYCHYVPHDMLTPIEAYRNDTQSRIEGCSNLYRLLFLRYKEDDLETFEYFSRMAKEESKKGFKKALETVSNAKAQEALKNYQIAFMVALEGMNTDSLDKSELIANEQRQEALKIKITEAWERFEIERDYQTERDNQALKPEMPFIFLK